MYKNMNKDKKSRKSLSTIQNLHNNCHLKHKSSRVTLNAEIPSAAQISMYAEGWDWNCRDRGSV